MVNDHDERPSPVQAAHQHKRSSDGLQAGWYNPSPAHLCNPVASPLVTAPPTRVGSETRSRHKAYGNPRPAGIPALSACPKRGHAIRRMETRKTRHCTYSYHQSETRSRHKAYGNMITCSVRMLYLSPKRGHAIRRMETDMGRVLGGSDEECPKRGHAIRRMETRSGSRWAPERAVRNEVTP